MDLNEIRERIDALDAEIVRLLDRRAVAGREAGRIKALQGKPLHNPERERAVLARLAGLSDGSLSAAGLENIYRTIMAETLALEQRDHGACPDHAREGRLDVTATVLENDEVAPGFYRMRLLAPELGGVFAPGQFFQLRIDAAGGETFLRRPFAPSETSHEGFTFVYAVVGRGTRLMTSLSRGATVGVLAPLGNAYTLPPAGSAALLVGGGCGAPSLAPLARRLREGGAGATVVVGARSAAMLLEARLFVDSADRVLLSTDDGSAGCRGTTLDALRTQAAAGLPKFDRVYACGPAPMLRAVAGYARERGVPCQVSLEERMACGFGACMGCAVAVRDGRGGTVYRRVCHDGPVFDAAELCWEETSR